MQKNVGKTDQLIRVVIGAVIVLLGLIYGSWWGLVGLIPLVTGILNYCPLYTLLGISTCTVKKTE